MSAFSCRLMRQLALSCAALLLALGTAQGQSEIQGGCVDAQGRAVRSVEDMLLQVPAWAAIEGGEPVLRYNTAAIPRLSVRARLFFQGHECARHALGQAVDAPPTLEGARRADCWALAALWGADAFDAGGEGSALQAELTFSAEEWRRLPGPPRTIDLDACRQRGVLRLPAGGLPSAAQHSSNRCVHACADRLWQCQKHCRDGACRGQCEAAYDHCEVRCPGR